MCWLWTYFRLPEPKGRTYGELDVLFERKIAARKFRGMDVNLGGAELVEDRERGSGEKGGLEMVEKF